MLPLHVISDRPCPAFSAVLDGNAAGAQLIRPGFDPSDRHRVSPRDLFAEGDRSVCACIVCVSLARRVFGLPDSLSVLSVQSA